MTDRSRISAFAIIICLLVCLFSPALGETLQECHRVSNTYTENVQDNKSVVRLWHIGTVLTSVNDELNSIAEGYAEQLSPALPAQKNKTTGNSRLDVEIRYSRTGLTWMSFLVQARTTYRQKLTAQVFTTRTYNMITGERITLQDIFPENSSAWSLISDRVRQQLTAYWPDVEPDINKLDELVSRQSLEQADFTLHGMSLVLHFPADALYSDCHTLMDVDFFYPEIRPLMTETAAAETDNTSYYKTCALTFDDGPSASNTPKVLNSLMETGTRATFFVIGNRIKENRYLVQHEHDNGHSIGSHNWHHGNATKSSGSALRAMPKKVETAMVKSIGIDVLYNRVPGGRYPAMIKAKVGWPLIQWSLDTYDWRGKSTAVVLDKVKKQIADGDIILCHDIKDNTPESARQIANYLAENGYILLTVDELFAKDGIELQPNKVYYRCTDGVTSIKK